MDPVSLPMTRRKFIEIAAAGTAAAACTATARERELDDTTCLAFPHLLDVLRDERLVRELGRHYREITPGEVTHRALSKAIMTDVDPNDRSPFAGRLSQRIRRDFGAGRTVTLHGWILSVTEARQCALFSCLPL